MGLSSLWGLKMLLQAKVGESVRPNIKKGNLYFLEDEEKLKFTLGFS